MALNQFNTIIAVVIPCYKVKNQIVDVISKIGDEVSYIVVVDDCCPESSGKHVKETCHDDRVQLVFNETNLGVGGATIAGIEIALKLHADIIIKLDGDGQYDPALIPSLVLPIVDGYADVAKGNRFFNIDNLGKMPLIRVIGNAALSFINKLVSGYWNVMDPTNGFVAIHRNILLQLPLEKLDKRYYFESDLLFRLNTIRAVVHDVPLTATYGEENSSLIVSSIIFSFPAKQLNRFFKRIGYSYFLRDFNIGSISLVFGIILFVSGLIYTLARWLESSISGMPATAGMVMIGAIQLVIGMQLILTFLNYDVANVPKIVQHKLLARRGDLPK